MKISEGSARTQVRVHWGFNSNSSSTLYVPQELPVDQPGFQPSGFISLSFPQSPYGDLPALKTRRLKGISLFRPVYVIGQLPHSQIPSSCCPPLCISLPIFVDSWVCQGGYEAPEAPWAGHPCWCTVCTQLTDTESDSPSSLSQVSDAITAIIIMEVLLALEGHVLKKQEAKKKKETRNKKQNQWPEGSVLSAVTLCIKESLVLLDSFES